MHLNTSYYTICEYSGPASPGLFPQQSPSQCQMLLGQPNVSRSGLHLCRNSSHAPTFESCSNPWPCCTTTFKHINAQWLWMSSPWVLSVVLTHRSLPNRLGSTQHPTITQIFPIRVLKTPNPSSPPRCSPVARRQSEWQFWQRHPPNSVAQRCSEQLYLPSKEPAPSRSYRYLPNSGLGNWNRLNIMEASVLVRHSKVRCQTLTVKQLYWSKLC